ncbi:MAG TPA: PilZ domain-containing protein [Myxococcales bacterium]|nr:PilZ domain-containing protein [Myxococcales bacterium]
MVPVPLVRYRFGASANVDLHFHEIDGRSFFFYPSGLQYRDGQWVFAEFGVHGATVSCMLRGRVYGQQSPRFTGSWFEFPVRGFPKVLRQLEATRRARERLAVDVTASVRLQSGAKALTRISDISSNGLRLSGLPFLIGQGEEISIEMVGGPRGQSDLGKGRVIWVRMQEAGVEFKNPTRPSFISILEQAEMARRSAAELAHSDSCSCRHGERPSEPPLPSIARRAK